MVQRPKIAVTGAEGQLGKEFRDLADHYPAFDFVFLTRADMPIEDKISVERVVQKIKPVWLVNCAAYTAVDKAEEEKELAFLVNATAVGYLAEACNSNNTKFIHISTDYVFNGNAHEPYREDSMTDPQSVYASSKLAGEKLAGRVWWQPDKPNPTSFEPGAIILRTSWVYSTYGNNFVKTMIRLMKEKKQLGIVNDQIGSPTYAADLAETIMQIIVSGNWEPGIFHYSNSGEISWYEFAVAIKEITGSDCIIEPISSTAYPTVAHRPLYSVLDKCRIQNVYEIKLKHWKDSLRTCLSKTS